MHPVTNDYTKKRPWGLHALSRHRAGATALLFCAVWLAPPPPCLSSLSTPSPRRRRLRLLCGPVGGEGGEVVKDV